MSDLTWTRGKADATYGHRTITQTTHSTSIGSTEFRARKVDDLWFIETRKDADHFGTPNGGHPLYAHTLREAKATVQGIADRVAAQTAKINAAVAAKAAR